MLYCFHLFHIATLFDLLGRVIRGATKHADQLLVGSATFHFGKILRYRNELANVAISTLFYAVFRSVPRLH